MKFRIDSRSRMVSGVYSSPRGFNARAPFSMDLRLRRHDYTVFVVYRLVVAAIIVLLVAGGVRDATF